MYNAFGSAMRERFGCKVYRLSLDGGMTCPNRDGKIGSRGCIFCGEEGAGEFAEKACESVTDQLEKAKERVSRKIKDGKYIAYFQSYTNTYAPTDKLRKMFSEAISHPEVVALSVATRPDCLPEDVVELLGELNRQKPVWVELGLQTIYPQSAAYIRRGYPLEVFEDAVKRLKEKKLEIIVHMIIGLPGETEEMIYETASYIGNSGADGVKFHLLHILRGTDLYTEYEAGRVIPLTLEEYIKLLCGCIERIPKDMVIHRMTGDGSKKVLAAPLWSGDKKRVLNAINRAIREQGIVQGSKFVKCAAAAASVIERK